jgi:hypothetical protein
VVSVNDDLFLVGDDQQFGTIVSLDEGPNLVEILAISDSEKSPFIRIRRMTINIWVVEEFISIWKSERKTV